MKLPIATVALLTLSNVFMTFAWYGHLKNLKGKFWLIAVVVSWGIAFFEYMLQVPANRLGAAQGLTLPQLKIMQEAIALTVFIPFAVFYMHEKVGWNYIAACLCIAAAVFFIFFFKN